MSETPMERLERALARFKDNDLLPGGLVRVDDLRAVVAVAKDARSWSDDVTRLVARVKELDGVDTLVSACPWSERPLDEQGRAQGVEVYDIFELVAEAAGYEV